MLNSLLSTLCIVVTVLSVSTGFSLEKNPVEVEPGYLSEVESPEDEVPQFMVLLPRPPSMQGYRSLKDAIFDAKISRELRIRYEQRLGRTDAEAVRELANPISYHIDQDGRIVFAVDQNNQQRDFAEFMMRRLGEYHVESFFKKKAKGVKSVQKVLILKQAVSNYKFELSPGYKIRANYSISGNYLDFKLLNPIVDTYTRMDLGSRVGKETTVSLVKELASDAAVEAHYTMNARNFKIVGRKIFPGGYSTSLTASTYMVGNKPEWLEDLFLAGFSVGF